MFFDGSLMKTGAGACLLFISPLGKHLRYVLRLHFSASNNVAEYEALVNGLRIGFPEPPSEYNDEEPDGSDSENEGENLDPDAGKSEQQVAYF